MLKVFNDVIGMEFGLDKCTNATFIKGRSTSMSEIKLDESTNIREVDREFPCKYLFQDEGKKYSIER